MTSQYNRYNKYSSNSKCSITRREFHLTEEMNELLPISRVLCKGQKMFLYNGKTKPIEVQYFANDPLKTVNGLKQILGFFIDIIRFLVCFDSVITDTFLLFNMLSSLLHIVLDLSAYQKTGCFSSSTICCN